MNTQFENPQQPQLSGDDVERQLRAELAARPDAATALSLAQLLWQSGRHTEALEVVQANAQAAPTAEFRQALAEMTRVLIGPEAALAVVSQALDEFPDQPELLLTRLVLEMQSDLPFPALETAARILRLAPGHAATHINYQLLLMKVGRVQHALEDCEAATRELGPQQAFEQNRVAALLMLERHAQALSAAEGALAAFGEDPVHEHNRAGALVALGRGAEALEVIENSVAMFGQNLNWTALKVAAALSCGQREDEAVAELVSAMAAFGSDEAAIIGLTEPLAEHCNPARGIALLERFSREPGAALVYTGWARNMLAAFRYQDAIAVIDHARALGIAHPLLDLVEAVARSATQDFKGADELLARSDWPAFAAFYQPLRRSLWKDRAWDRMPVPQEIAACEYLAAFAVCDWTDYDQRLQFLRTLSSLFAEHGRFSPVTPLQSLMLPITNAERRVIAGSWARLGRLAAEAEGVSFTHAAREPGRRLRIGYVAGEFRDHAIAHLTRSMYGLHDRRRFEVYAYATRPGDRSHYHLKIAAECDRFTDISGLAAATAAQRIYDDRIDLLIDLCGFTGTSRLDVFALRPAPVNVTYLGFPGTTGADYIDFVIADPIVLPEEEWQHFSETPLLVPHCYQVNDAWQPIAEHVFTRAELGLPEHGVVFACNSRGDKIDPVTFAAWMEILRAVPDSVLWLLTLDPETKERLRRAAEREGVAATRILSGPLEQKDRHLRRLALADLFIDSFIYNGHTTASDALWAGLPVVTCRGDSFAGRVGASLLTAVGLPELIADNPREFVALAVELARDPQRRSQLRKQLSEVRRTPLYDTAGFVRELENLLLRAWELRGPGRAAGTSREQSDSRSPVERLSGSVGEYHAATDPVAGDDWEATR